jgi:signal transduction histidine kinase
MKTKGPAEPIAIETDPLPWQELLSTICHDLKDPLASVVMGTSYLQRALPTDDASAGARRVVDAIGRSTGRMAQLLSDLSDLALLDRHELKLRLAKHDVAALTRAVHEKFAAQATTHGITTTLDVAPELEGLELQCDGDRVTQILVQLGAGALRVVREKGTIAIRVAADGDARVRFELRTSGPTGAGNIEREAATPRMAVPKLPLALARGLIELHGGRIDATREADALTFAFTLPRTHGEPSTS